MKPIFYLGFLVVIGSFLFQSCYDDQLITELPPITNTGENTLGAVINGKIFVPQKNRSSLRLRLDTDFPDETNNYELEVFAQRLSGENINDDIIFNFRLPNVKEVGKYDSISASLFYKKNYFTYSKSAPWGAGSERNCDNVYGTVEISRLDTNNRIVSGLFKFNLNDTINSKCLLLTDGRFDLKDK